jgi:hypothetical protein
MDLRNPGKTYVEVLCWIEPTHSNLEGKACWEAIMHHHIGFQRVSSADLHNVRDQSHWGPLNSKVFLGDLITLLQLCILKDFKWENDCEL